ncbi:MAG TPA: CpsB/CapC family capsule biosynthesis tyrosine phosphatase [Thermoanaerobaculia bacterium]|nr:CpsB/CapC family capsule biosynthesis tyrosine phosphatase [Thermoanaerobaculia bacterium]
MIDLHCHILPGIDDGARSLAEAAEMCRLAAAAGCEALVATPHQRRLGWWNCDRAALAELRGRLQEAVGPALRILLGGEIHVDGQLLSEIVDLAGDPTHGPLPLAGSRYLLLEFGPDAEPPFACDLVHELAVAGWRPILAHPEFIPWMAEDLAVVARLVDLGAFVQVTAMSVTGDFSRRAQDHTHRLIERGLAHFVASDAHDLKRRPPGLRRAWEVIAGRWGEEAARALLEAHPQAVIADLPLPAEPAAAAERSAGRGGASSCAGWQPRA